MMMIMGMAPMMMIMRMAVHLTMSPELSAFLIQGERDQAAAACQDDDDDFDDDDNDDDMMMMTMMMMIKGGFQGGLRWSQGMFLHII